MEKKVNKKSIVAILAAMVMSLGIVSGIQQSRVKNNADHLQQVALAAKAAEYDNFADLCAVAGLGTIVSTGGTPAGAIVATFIML